MSSVYTCKDGIVRIDFIDHNKKKHTIKLGKNIVCSDAECFRILIDRLINIRKLGGVPKLHDLEQLKSISYKYYEKLVEWDIVQARVFAPVPKLKELCREFLEFQYSQNHSKRSDLNDKNAISRLLKICDGSQLISSITVSDAKKIKGLLLKRYSEGTVNRDIKRFRTLFNYAVDCKYVTENPFSKVEAGQSVNKDRMTYVLPETILSILPEDDSELRFIIILSRFAGLRIPSEVFGMKKSDFSDTSFFEITTSKTGRRIIPQFDIIRNEYYRHIKTLKPDQEYLFPYFRSKSETTLRNAFFRCIKKHGLKPWPRLWHNLRSCCLSDWVAGGISVKQIDKWAGNTELVREIHYLQETPVSRQNEKDCISLVNSKIYNHNENQDGNEGTSANTSVLIREKFTGFVLGAKNIWKQIIYLPKSIKDQLIDEHIQILMNLVHDAKLLKEN